MKKRNSWKRILSVVLTWVLVMAMIVPTSSSTVYAASKKADTTSTSYDITVGETLTLTATGDKVTYKSSNKKVADVSKKGIVTGKKEGTATITVTVTNKVKVKPAKTLLGKIIQKLFPKVTKTTTKYTINVKAKATEPTDPTDPTDPTEPTDPTDPTDPTEPTDPTDPSEPAVDEHLVDSDKDGIADLDEALYGTDPLKADTDDDGLSDFEEILLGTDPLVPNKYDEELDTDNDGLSDYEEATLYHTDPTVKDTDGDGLSDYEEATLYHTDPLSVDTDGDSLSDKFEVDHDLDPNTSSTDGETNDSSLKISQELPSSAISNSLTNSDNLAKPSISGEVAGEMSNNIYISTSSDIATEDNRSIVGKPIYIDGEDDYISGLNLSFDLSNYEGNMSSLIIASLDDEGNYIPVDSSLSGDTLSATINGSGTYFVLDIDEFLNSLGIDSIEKPEIMTLSMDYAEYEDNNEDANVIVIEKTDDDATTTVDSTEESTESNETVNEVAADSTEAEVSIEDEAEDASTIVVSEYAAEVNEVLLASLNAANDDLVSSTVSGQADIVFAIDTTGSIAMRSSRLVMHFIILRVVLLNLHKPYRQQQLQRLITMKRF